MDDMDVKFNASNWSFGFRNGFTTYKDRVLSSCTSNSFDYYLTTFRSGTGNAA